MAHDSFSSHDFPQLRRRGLLLAAAGVAGAAATPALAQFRVEVSGVGLTQIPISILSFATPGAAPQDVSAIVRADLMRSGRFRMVPDGGQRMDETVHPDMAQWRGSGADALATGRLTRTGDGRYDVRFRLWDVVRDQDLGGQGYVVSTGDLRLAAHRIADYIYEKLTGEKGVFATRIAYITRAGRRYTLWVADADGENAQPALTSGESIISPAWAPDGRSLAYVSFEARKPVIYVHNVATGARRLLANFKGSNSAPAWSPNGSQLAVTLSRAGGSQLFLISAAGGEPRRITSSSSIDTEPVFAPDGSTLYFVSDRAGGPQIYRMPISGGGATRVTFGGSYNVSPSISPDGRWMAYIGRTGGGYQLHVMELASGQATSISDGSDDEHPSFAPNSRMILYAAGRGSGARLTDTTLDGSVKTPLPAKGGDVREPAWGPYVR